MTAPFQPPDLLSFAVEMPVPFGLEPTTIVQPAVTSVGGNNDEPAGSPLWWVRRLHWQLDNRRRSLEFFDAYYRGAFPLPWLPRQAQSEFRRVLRMTRSNYMGLVVDSKAERIQVEGFRVGGEDSADQELWRIWQANDLDSDSDQAFLEALIGGCSYLLVAPNPSDPSTPLVTVEHASQTIVEYVPGHGRRVAAAGLKVWVDDWSGERMSTLYLPDSVHKFVSAGMLPGGPDWQYRDGYLGQPAVGPNPLGAVPLFELPNNPRLLTGGVSELADLTDIQDRINKTIADRLITQDFGAFPQKWATGYPLVDDAGNSTPPIDIGRNRILSTDVAETRFGQFDAAPLDPYSAAKREDVKDIASRSRTPAQYLLGEMSNVNGECLALDTPIPTPNGLVPIGDIAEGDEVYDERGHVQRVEQAHVIHINRACFKVQFDDGSEFVTDARHRWPVVSIPLSKRAGRGIAQRTHRDVLTTEEIAASLLAANGQKVHAIDLALPPDGPEVDLLVDPYVLGAWLGDGSRGSGRICAGAQDVEETVAALTAAGETVATTVDGRGLHWLTLTRDGKSLRARLLVLGVLDCKRIPEVYFRGSFKQRLALLQGLMDTDGTASGHEKQSGSVALDLHDADLARDAHRLICSLGHKVALRQNSFTKQFGDRTVTGTRNRMRWVPLDVVFRLERKAVLQRVPRLDRPKTLRRTIVAVTPTESVPVRCLTVSGPSHLFLAGVQHVPTHNTLKASESGLIAAVKQRRRHFGEGLERAMRAAQALAGSRPDPMLETIWTNPEFRTEGELVDATVKKLAAGITSLRQAREDVGYTQTQIARLEQDDQSGTDLQSMVKLLSAPPVAAAPGPSGTVGP